MSDSTFIFRMHFEDRGHLSVLYKTLERTRAELLPAFSKLGAVLFVGALWFQHSSFHDSLQFLLDTILLIHLSDKYMQVGK